MAALKFNRKFKRSAGTMTATLLSCVSVASSWFQPCVTWLLLIRPSLTVLAEKIFHEGGKKNYICWIKGFSRSSECWIFWKVKIYRFLKKKKICFNFFYIKCVCSLNLLIKGILVKGTWRNLLKFRVMEFFGAVNVFF